MRFYNFSHVLFIRELEEMKVKVKQRKIYAKQILMFY